MASGTAYNTTYFFNLDTANWTRLGDLNVKRDGSGRLIPMQVVASDAGSLRLMCLRLSFWKGIFKFSNCLLNMTLFINPNTYCHSSIENFLSYIFLANEPKKLLKLFFICI